MKTTNATKIVEPNPDEAPLSASAMVGRAQIKLLRLLAQAAVETLQKITQAEVDDANTSAASKDRNASVKSGSNRKA